MTQRREAGETSAALAALVVAVRRDLHPAGWSFELRELGVSAHGFAYEEALASLAAAVRRRVAEVLDDEHTAASRHELALLLHEADDADRLEAILTGAFLLDDERAERLLREQAGQGPPETG